MGRGSPRNLRDLAKRKQSRFLSPNQWRDKDTTEWTLWGLQRRKQRSLMTCQIWFQQKKKSQKKLIYLSIIISQDTNRFVRKTTMISRPGSEENLSFPPETMSERFLIRETPSKTNLRMFETGEKRRSFYLCRLHSSLSKYQGTSGSLSARNPNRESCLKFEGWPCLNIQQKNMSLAPKSKTVYFVSNLSETKINIRD